MKKSARAPEGRTAPGGRPAAEAESGLLRIPSAGGCVEGDAQLMELRRLRPGWLDPRLRLPGVESLARSEAMILNVDYPLGMAAYFILTQIAARVGEVHGIYVTGKCATLNVAIGDVMIPKVVYDEQSRNTYLFQNCFIAQDVVDDFRDH